MFVIPLMYAKLGVFVESINIAQSAPITPPIINDISKYFGLEHMLVVLHMISAKINIGKMTSVGMFCVCKLLYSKFIIIKKVFLNHI